MQSTVRWRSDRFLHSLRQRRTRQANEAKERQLCPLIAPLGKTFAADLQGKVEEWAAGNTRAAQMKEMAACVPMAGAGGPGPAKRAKLVAGARSSRDREPRFSRDRAEIEPRSSRESTCLV